MKCDKKDLLLYAVTDRSWLNAETLTVRLRRHWKVELHLLQLREKHLDHDAFLQEAKEIQRIVCKVPGTVCAG